jgi:5-hydroxyisourate hydrolase
MPGISIHVVDVARGVMATGMRVELRGANSRLADGVVSSTGLVEAAPLAGRFDVGEYEVLLHIGAFYRAAGVALPSVPFLNIAVFRFGISDSEQPYHLPFKLTPFGYSCFRGGA